MYDINFSSYAMSLFTFNLKGSAAAWLQDFVQEGEEVYAIEELTEITLNSFFGSFFKIDCREARSLKAAPLQKS